MEASYQSNLRSDFYRFLTNLEYLHNVYIHAEKYRFQRHVELSPLITRHNYSEFIQRFGETTLKDFYHIELFFKPLLLHSVFISAYSAFELHLRTIAEALEANIPNTPSIRGIKASKDSYIELSRKYIYTIHHYQSAAINIHWNRINEFRKVRNALVHAGGRVPIQDQARLQPFLSAYNVNLFPQNDPIIIREAIFLTDFFLLTKAFLQGIIQDIAPVPKLRHIP